MAFEFFSKNGYIIPMDEAVIDLRHIEYCYGFGVYESLRVVQGSAYFVEQHVARLVSSAAHISLEHSFAPQDIQRFIQEFVYHLGEERCNLKILLIGGRTAADAQLVILPLNPLFPDKKLYKRGATTITFPYERLYPHAKTLNMLPSYLAYRDAKKRGAYDALFVSRDGCLLEGTRTNFYVMQDRTIITPPTQHILEGVTRMVCLSVAREHGYDIQEADIVHADVQKYEAAFLTSTSSKVMPLATIDDVSFTVTQPLKDLMKAFDEFVTTCGGVLDQDAT